MKEKTSDLLKLIEFEIQRIQIDNKRPGWSVWALLGSIAAISWLILQEFEDNLIDSHKLFFAIFSLSLIIDLTIILFNSFSSGINNRLNSHRYLITRDFYKPITTYCFINFIRMSILLLILSNLNLEISKLSKTFIYFFYSIQLYSCLYALIYSFIKKPIIITKTLLITTFILLFILLIIGSLGLLSVIPILIQFNLKNMIVIYRLAGLIVILSYLILLISIIHTKDHNLIKIINLQRNLVLGKITHNSAINQVEIIFSGMELDQIFNNEINLILNLMNSTIQEVEIANTQLNNLIAKFGSNLKDLSNEDKNICKPILLSSQKHFKKADDLYTLFNKKYEKLMKNVKKATSFSANPQTDSDKVFTNFKNAFEEVYDKLNTYKKNITKLNPYNGIS